MTTHRSIANRSQSLTVDEGFEYFPPVDRHLVRSKYVAQTFEVHVMQPVRRQGEAARFPVVYATDANLTFDMFKGICRLVQSSHTEGSRFILVGIGYPSDSPMGGAVLRARDFTFAGYPQLDIKVPPIDGVLVAPKGHKNFYGADDFQQFLQHELIPLIDKRYDTLAGERTYFGHSGGGGFGLYTLFTRRHLFKNYIVSSPGIVYHGENAAGTHYDNYDFLLQRARAFLSAREDLGGTRIYMSVGSEEEFEPALVQWQLTSSFHRLAALIKAAAPAGLELKTEVFSGETHLSVWPMAFMRGVRAMFGAPRPG